MKIIITEEQCKRLMEEYIDFPVDEDIALEVWEQDDLLELTTLVLPKHMRGQGKGTEIMNMVCDYADQVNKPLYLTPSTSYGGTSIGRLKRFYGEFGFEKNKDQKISHTLVRHPHS